jgi:hypothetical protein
MPTCCSSSQSVKRSGVARRYGAEATHSPFVIFLDSLSSPALILQIDEREPNRSFYKRDMTMWNVVYRALAGFACAIIVVSLSGPATAQSVDNFAAGNMWGTTPGGVSVNGAADSAYAHGENSATAAAVNAARSGLLVGTGAGGGSVYSIGSQSIISSTVIGNDNSVGTNGSQTTTNTGDVSNSGQLGKTNNGAINNN